MPIDYYPQKTEAELLLLLDALQKRASEGQVFFTTAIGMQSQRSFQGAARVEVEIRRVMYSLYRKGAFGFTTDPYAERIRKTRARYTFS